MEKDVKIGIVILIIAILLSGITYVVNSANLYDAIGFFSFLNKPLMGEGLGPLCSSLSDCQNFCHKNMGRCNEYCQANPTNKICDSITQNENK